MKIRFFDPGKGYRKIKHEIDTEIERVLGSGELILREDVEKFENTLARFIGTKYAVGLNSGTDALILSLKALGIGEGDEVITVSNTFKATITAIRAVGAKPVILDIGDDYLMDLKLIEKAITKRTKAIIPVHLSGDVVDFSKEMPHEVIEDAAQALGASFPDGTLAGSRGTTGCFSFYPAKILGAYGDAGAVVTNDKNIAEELREMRNHYKGKPGKDGMNSRLDNLQAAVLNVKFRYLQEFINRRAYIASMYDFNLGTLPITLPRKRIVYQDYIIRTERRDELKDYLAEKGIETMVPPILPHEELGIRASLPKTEKYNKGFLRLPCNPELTNEEISYVIENIKKFYV